MFNEFIMINKKVQYLIFGDDLLFILDIGQDIFDVPVSQVSK